MSSAFVKEGDEMWLRDIPPTMDALINYLSRENGIRIIEKARSYDPNLKKEIYKMSDGFSYVVLDNVWTNLD
jgi:hypothetical protein